MIRRKRNARAFWTVVHRWAGLSMAGFLVLAGFTGSLLAWLDELEAWIAPRMVLAAPPAPNARPLDPFMLQEKVRAQLPPDVLLPWIPLHVEPGRTVRFGVVAMGERPLPYDDVFVNPYTGAIQEQRLWGDITQGAKNVMSFVYRLHYSLALDRAGVVLMGIVALVWTLDCFVGAYLTFPARRKRRAIRPAQAAPAIQEASWFARWWPAWRIRWEGGSYKLNFDLHRAGGLWIWAMLFVLAWSSVAFNLREVYAPVTVALMGRQEASPARDHVPLLAQPRHEPLLAPREALAAARRLMAGQAAQRGFRVEREDWLGYEPARGLYTYIVTSDRDIRERYGGNTRLFLDGDSGAYQGLYLPTGGAAGDTFTTWITTLHMAALWGLPMKLFVCATGLAVAMLSVTGVVIWARKSRARVASKKMDTLAVESMIRQE